MGNVKETVVQFGEGGFLRGFVDYFLQKMKDQGLFDGSVVVVQPIEKGMCEMLEKQNCQYNLFLRGIDNGQVVDEHTHIDIINRCINPYADPEGYMALAENRDLRFIVSNTTEAGIEFVPEVPVGNACKGAGSACRGSFWPACPQTGSPGQTQCLPLWYWTQ